MRWCATFMIGTILSTVLCEQTEAQWKVPAEQLVGSSDLAFPQTSVIPHEPRIGLTVGMGVSYVNPQDIVDYIRGRVGRGQDLPEFKSSVEFFGACSIPLSNDWLLKFEYAYLLGTYNVQTILGPGEFSFSAHMPTVIGQYVLVDEGSYNVKVGAGGGYHVGVLTESFGTLNDKLTGQGVGSVVELEANTAFSEEFYGSIGGNLRWEFVGDLTSPTRSVSAGSIPTLHFFGLGVRFGFTYYF